MAGQFNSVDELKRFPIRAVNTPRARPAPSAWATSPTVRRDYVDPPSVKVRHQGKR